MNTRRKKDRGRKLIKRYEHGGEHPTDEELDDIRQFNQRRQQSVSQMSREFLNKFYSQPHVRQKIAENLSRAPGGVGPAPEAKETSTYKTLARMYPNRIDEMSTYEGLANVVADHYGDYSASMGNFKFGDDDSRTRGYVEFYRPDQYDQEISDRAKAHPQVQRLRSNEPRSRSGAGRVTKPFTMGMRPYQERMNVSVQVDPYAPTSTYVHELTHAADLRDNPGNIAIMDKYRKRLSPTMDPYEIKENFESLVGEANKARMGVSDFLAYVGQPSETLARLNAIRYDMIEEAGYRGEETNPMDYEYAFDDIPTLMKHGGKGTAFKQLAAVYGAENVVEMLNEIY